MFFPIRYKSPASWLGSRPFDGPQLPRLPRNCSRLPVLLGTMARLWQLSSSTKRRRSLLLSCEMWAMSWTGLTIQRPSRLSSKRKRSLPFVLKDNRETIASGLLEISERSLLLSTPDAHNYLENVVTSFLLSKTIMGKSLLLCSMTGSQSPLPSSNSSNIKISEGVYCNSQFYFLRTSTLTTY